MCTPWDLESIKILESFQVQAYKVASADLTNDILLEKVAQYKKPMILSVGASSDEEILYAINLLKRNEVLEGIENSLGKNTVTWLGHMTAMLRIDGKVILTDPWFTSYATPLPPFGPKRYVAPGLKLVELPKVDFIVISHNHYDHLDVPTLKALAQRNPQTVFFVPLGNGELLRNNNISQVVELDWGQQADFRSLTIHCLPSQHWSKRTLTDTNKTLWASWAVTGGERRVYYAGDSGYFPGFTEIGRQLGPFDLVIVPIGAYAPRAMMLESHMNPEEAFDAASDLGASKALGVHFGTFDLSDEPLAEPPQRFLNTGSSAPAAAPTPWIFKIGETRSF